MNLNLENYVKIYPALLDNMLVSASLSALQSTDVSWQQNYFYNPKNHAQETKSGKNELDMTFDSIATSPELMQAIRTAIHAYLTDLKLPWFTSWNGYSKIRFNKYEPNKEMALHYDCIHELFDGSVKGVPTLSIIGALNQDYTGGELIMFDDYEIKLNPGDIVIFPSTFLYPHRVKPVTAGCRYAFVSWVW